MKIGKRCDKTIFMTSISNDTLAESYELDLVHLNFSNNYSRLTDKTIQTILYTYVNLINEFDWFLKAGNYIKNKLINLYK